MSIAKDQPSQVVVGTLWDRTKPFRPATSQKLVAAPATVRSTDNTTRSGDKSGSPKAITAK